MTNRTNTPAETDAKIAATFATFATLAARAAQIEFYANKDAARAASSTSQWVKDAAARNLAAAGEARAAADEARAAYTEANSLYEGWTRFFLVQNGHIHSTMDCSTCNRWTSKEGSYSQSATQFAWLTELSGRTEADTVAEFGGILCTVCYPSAPAEHTNGENKKDAAAKEAAAALRAERRAAKEAKAAKNSLGVTVTVGRDKVSTVTAAKQTLTNAAFYSDGRHPSYPQADVAELLAALAAKTGTAAEALWTAAQKRAAK